MNKIDPRVPSRTSNAPKQDLRTWLAQMEAAGEVQHVSGAGREEEIGGIVDFHQRRIGNPAVLFDDIPGYPRGHRVLANYLLLVHFPTVGELTVFCGALVGASLGFLWWNAHPAEVFMGDVGSLALGGAIGTVAILIKQELLLPIVGGVFVLEAGSVIIQVASFKLTGKRVFRMAPLHHHFELMGWQEPKVIMRFLILAIIFALCSLTTLKLR